MKMERRIKQQIKIKNPTDIFPVMGKWKKRREENFLTVTLNGKHIILKIHHITKGLVNRTIAHPRECFFPAIRDFATAVIFVHNHPSGEANPSIEDDIVTEQLCMAGVIMGIHVLDHIIITPQNNFYSYRQSGKIKEDFSTYKKRRFIEELAAEGEQ
jgi:DNA repair protein RadC